MKELITKLNKIFDNRLRLGIMSILLVSNEADFNRLKEMLDATDGNLASHLRALEKERYIQVHKQFVGRKPNTSYEVTDSGRKAFSEHLDALEKILNNSRPELSSEEE
ncbi:MAG: transcriptional regulator [Lewinellaceae bacterium]|nr:transcriptional regulator [Phaeodactylibacter sp.]MCB9346179.1 transcriptional regulator [Lewinellaceae bacterium]